MSNDDTLLEALANYGKEPAKFKHNWLYSVLPITPTYTKYPNNYTTVPQDWFIFSGYCRNCDSAFSAKVPINSDGSLLVTKNVGIPKEGCVDPASLL